MVRAKLFRTFEQRSTQRRYRDN